MTKRSGCYKSLGGLTKRMFRDKDLLLALAPVLIPVLQSSVDHAIAVAAPKSDPVLPGEWSATRDTECRLIIRSSQHGLTATHCSCTSNQG